MTTRRPINPDAIFKIPRGGAEGDVDLRENFQKLNRLFGNGAFELREGRIEMGFTNVRLATDADGPFVVKFDFLRLGPFVMLEIAQEVTETAKINGSTPVSTGKLPLFLRPRATAIYMPTYTVNNAGSALSFMAFQVYQDGEIKLDVYNESWSTNDDVRLFPGNVCYLGQ